jgi:hypothetical protein
MTVHSHKGSGVTQIVGRPEAVKISQRLRYYRIISLEGLRMIMKNGAW